MTNVIELAKQAGFDIATGMNKNHWPCVGGIDIEDEVVLLIKLVRNAALEEAAQKCVNYPEWAHWGQTDNYVIANKGAQDCAAAIESLKEPTP